MWTYGSLSSHYKIFEKVIYCEKQTTTKITTNRVYFFNSLKTIEELEALVCENLKGKSTPSKLKMYLKTGTAQIKFPIFLRRAKTCNANVWRNLGDGTKNKRNEQMEKLTKLVKKRNNSFCDGRKPEDKQRQLRT